MPNKVLLLTNLSWVRNPYGDPLKNRPNPNLFRPTYFNFKQIQIGRHLSEEEVLTINYILKNRAKRYISAPRKEWLYPENKLNERNWDFVGNSYLLMPDPRSLNFSSEIIFKHKKGYVAFDEYGREPGDMNYQQKEQHNYEWHAFNSFKGEYARLFGPKRRGISYNFNSLDKEVDSENLHNYHLGLEKEHKKFLQE